MLVTVNSVNGGQPPAWVTPNPQSTALSTGSGGNCTIAGALETCSLKVFAPPGLVNYTFSVENGSSQVLSTLLESITVTQGQTTLPSVALQSVVASVTIIAPTLQAGTPTSAALPVAASDASGTVLSGSTPYNNPITLTDSDTSGATSLSLNGGSPGQTVTLHSPSDVVTFAYSGLALNPFAVTASGSGISGSTPFSTTNNPIVVTGTTPDNTAHGGLPTDPNYNAPTVFFSGTIQAAQSFSASETGWSNSPFGKTFSVALDATTCKAGASAVASITPASPPGATTFSVTPLNVGFCKLTVTDGVGQSSILWVSVTTTSIPVN